MANQVYNRVIDVGVREIQHCKLPHGRYYTKFNSPQLFPFSFLL